MQVTSAIHRCTGITDGTVGPPRHYWNGHPSFRTLSKVLEIQIHRWTEVNSGPWSAQAPKARALADKHRLIVVKQASCLCSHLVDSHLPVLVNPSSLLSLPFTGRNTQRHLYTHMLVHTLHTCKTSVHGGGGSHGGLFNKQQDLHTPLPQLALGQLMQRCHNYAKLAPSVPL
jgi:hypothetical protein